MGAARGRRGLVTVVLALALVVGAAACGSQERRPAPEPGPTGSVPSEPADAMSVAEAAGVSLPVDAEVRRAERRDGPAATASLLVFTTTSEAAEAFCADFGLGGALPSSAGVTDEEREAFGVEGDTAATVRRCGAVHPDDPSVERRVLITSPDQDTATVHLVVLTAPR